MTERHIEGSTEQPTDQPTERPRPYIGVSGVVNPEQQAALGAAFDAQGFDTSRVLALGVKATHKPQWLEKENKYGREWYPVGDELTHALARHESELHVAQVFLDLSLVQDNEYREHFMERIHRRGRAWLNAVQFDMLPIGRDPSLPDFIEKLKSKTGLTILLQAHSGMMESYNPEQLARVMSDFAADYVLLDSSHGKGVRLDTDRLRPYVEALYASDSLSSVGIGIAGGLNAEVVASDLPELVGDFPDISWDAEGQLHRPNEDNKRPVNLDDARDYLAASAEVLRGA